MCVISNSISAASVCIAVWFVILRLLLRVRHSVSDENQLFGRELRYEITLTAGNGMRRYLYSICHAYIVPYFATNRRSLLVVVKGACS